MLELVPPRNLSQPGAPLAARVAGEARLAELGGGEVVLGGVSSNLRAGGGGRGESSLTMSPALKYLMPKYSIQEV